LSHHEGELIAPTGAGRREMESRNIIDLWDNYEAERAPILEERRKRDEEDRIKWEEQRKQQEEKRAAFYFGDFIHRLWQKELNRRAYEEARKKQQQLERRIAKINVVLRGRGLKEFSVTPLNVSIPLGELERWLNIKSESD
jgi:hypothetical protein